MAKAKTSQRDFSQMTPAKIAGCCVDYVMARDGITSAAAAGKLQEMTVAQLEALCAEADAWREEQTEVKVAAIRAGGDAAATAAHKVADRIEQGQTAVEVDDEETETEEAPAESEETEQPAPAKPVKKATRKKTAKK